MKENVVNLRGEPVADARKPVPGLVAELEKLLEAARSGEIVALACAYKHHNNIVAYSFAGAVQGYAMIGGLECVKLRLAERANRTD